MGLHLVGSFNRNFFLCILSLIFSMALFQNCAQYKGQFSAASDNSSSTPTGGDDNSELGEAGKPALGASATSMMEGTTLNLELAWMNQVRETGTIDWVIEVEGNSGFDLTPYITSTSGQISISDSSVETFQVAIQSIDNANQEGLVPLVLKLSSSDDKFASTEVPITMFDDESNPVLTHTDLIFNEGENSNLQFNLSLPASGTITFDLTAVDGTAVAGTDFNSFTQTVTITTGQSSINVPITSIQDTLVEGTETMSYTISNLVGADLINATGNIYIRDDDAQNADITGGWQFTCAHKTGKAYCWGRGEYGQLGNGATARSLIPYQVSGLDSGIQEISAGHQHACAIKNGALKCWGRNDFGNLGDGTFTNRLAPIQTTGMDMDVVSIEMGGQFSCAIKAGGALYCWGRNNHGQIGDGTTTNRSAPVRIFDDGVSAVSLGDEFACAVRNGALYCWGRNSEGQVGDGTGARRGVPTMVSGMEDGVTRVWTGRYHTCAIQNDRTKCWGQNDYGQVGIGNTNRYYAPTIIFPYAVQSMGLGSHSTCVVHNNNLQCVGFNGEGGLGNNTRTNSTAFVNVVNANNNNTDQVANVGLHHMCAKINNDFYCWGQNDFGQLGDNTTGRKLVPTLVPVP